MTRTKEVVQLRLRLAVSAAVGVAAGLVVGATLDAIGGVALAWAVFTLVDAIWVLVVVWRMDARQTAEYATVEDPGRRAARLAALCGSLVSLVVVAWVVTRAQHSGVAQSAALAGIAVLTVVGSWLLIQVDYMLHYADVYYREPRGGLDFNQEEDPQYSDFLYFAVGIGLTYQVADNDVCTNEIRRIVVGQTLLGYLFCAVFLATVINLVTGLG